MRHNFLTPSVGFEGFESFELFLRERFEAIPLDVLIARHPTDGRLASQGAAVSAIDDPLQNAHVFAEAWPHEFTVSVLAEPVHMEDPRRFGQAALHLDPVTEVIAHVIAAERQHRHGIAANLADGANNGRSGFRTHGGARVYTCA